MPNPIRFNSLFKLAFAQLVLVFSVSAALAQQPKTSPKSATTFATPNREDVTVAPRLNEDMLAAIKQRGKLRIGVAKAVPWAMHNKKGDLVGFEIDVAKNLSRDLGVEAEFYPVHFSQLIPDLLDGRYDIIISGLSIKADRALKVNFSDSYNDTGLTLAAGEKLAGKFKTLQAFNKIDVTIGAINGSTAEDVINRLLPQATIKTYEEDGDLLNDLIEGRLHAVVMESPRPELVAKYFPGKVVIPLTGHLATFPAAFAVRRGDMDFVNFLNSWIRARTVNAWLERRRNYWFKSDSWSKDL